MEQLRKLLDRFVDTSELTDIEVLRIIEAEAMKENSFLKLDHIIGGK